MNDQSTTGTCRQCGGKGEYWTPEYITWSKNDLPPLIKVACWKCGGSGLSTSYVPKGD